MLERLQLTAVLLVELMAGLYWLLLLLAQLEVLVLALKGLQSQPSAAVPLCAGPPADGADVAAAAGPVHRL